MKDYVGMLWDVVFDGRVLTKEETIELLEIERDGGSFALAGGTKLEDQIYDLESDRDDLQVLIASLDVAADDAQDELDDLNDEITELKDQKKKLEEEIDFLERKRKAQVNE